MGQVKSRKLFFDGEVNTEKICVLIALHAAYIEFLAVCVDILLQHYRCGVPLAEKLDFFPKKSSLPYALAQSAKDHASAIVKGWYATKYETHIRKHISHLRREGQITDDLAKQLYTIGKHQIDKPWGNITQDEIDIYWYFLTDEEIAGSLPRIRGNKRIPIMLDERGGVIEHTPEMKHSQWWLRLTTFQKYHRIQIPLKSNPHVKSLPEIRKGLLVQRDRSGKWYVQVIERYEQPDFILDPNAAAIGVDVGLNVIAATSEGELFGQNVKSEFIKLYDRAQTLRKNRQRQELGRNSRKLDKLEYRLSGMVKTEAGRVAGQIARRHQGKTAVLEQLDFTHLKGSHRMAYKAVGRSLQRKMVVIYLLAAYTSQICPSCGYLSRLNRHSTKFKCRSCGRKSHADVVGAINLFNRYESGFKSSAYEEVDVKASLKTLKKELEERYRLKRNSSLTLKSSTAFA